jgi:NAD+ synthase (glutamine-hydrolysing)
MKLLKLGAVVLNQVPLDWPGNQARIRAAIEEARRAGVNILCLPEMCITGYGCEDAFLSPNTIHRAWNSLMQLLPATKGMIVSFGLPILHQHGLFNCACLVVDGKIAGFTAKRFLAGDGIHYEPRWFKPWPQQIRNDVSIEGVTYPMGDLHFDCGGVRIGFEVCEDAWVANRPGATLALKGVDIILNPSASHFAFGKLEIRKRFVLEGSRAFGTSYVYANLLGNEAGRAIYDGGALIASGGKLLATGPRFGFHDFYLTIATVDVEAIRLAQARTASFQPMLDTDDHCRIQVPFEFPAAKAQNDTLHADQWETSATLKEEEFTRAETLALFDYLRKSRSRGFVVSLSGGADSAATVCLVYLMVEAALKALGPEGFKAKLGFMPALTVTNDAKAVTRQLLTTAYQGSDNSGAVTRNAASTVAAAIGAEHYDWQVGEIVSRYVKTIEQATGFKLDWAQHDIPLQNIQARVRSPGVWLLANLKNALLLSTSNRSEAAVGYATMDGDTSGGLSPLAGIDKAWLRHWLRWLETSGPDGLHPIPALAVINQQAPTAELRPASHKQTDEEDLMPYDVLDAIERAAIRDKQGPLEVFELMKPQFPNYPARQMGVWVDRFFRLWSRNQWKRERYAPSFHLDDENLDPKTWCRFPILSGGFETELAELRELIERTG